ncbi:MAG: hypothetical protein ACLQDQ_19470 [Myxococcaceae bacterium]
MAGLDALWLPVLLSAVFVFLVSSVIHMVLPWHKSDYPLLPNQDRVMDALRPLSIPPGDYFIPRPSNRQEMRSPEFIEKMKKGPVVLLTVMPNGLTPMGKNLAMWFAYCLIVGLLTALVAHAALPVGADYRRVFHLVGVTAFIGYSVALWQMSIWYRRAWSLTIKSTLDGVIYALLTAGTFGWLWPR